jgi:hypothetical protein
MWSVFERMYVYWVLEGSYRKLTMPRASVPISSADEFWSTAAAVLNTLHEHAHRDSIHGCFPCQ